MRSSQPRGSSASTAQLAARLTQPRAPAVALALILALAIGLGRAVDGRCVRRGDVKGYRWCRLDRLAGDQSGNQAAPRQGRGDFAVRDDVFSEHGWHREVVGATGGGRRAGPLLLAPPGPRPPRDPPRAW